MNSITIDLCAKTVLDKRGSDVAQIWDLSAPRAKAHHAVRPKWAISVPTAWRTQRLDNRQTVFALALDLVLHDHFKYQLVMHWSILMKTSCSNISILHAASKQSRIKLHQNGCFHLVLPIYCITCFDCVGFKFCISPHFNPSSAIKQYSLRSKLLGARCKILLQHQGRYKWLQSRTWKHIVILHLRGGRQPFVMSFSLETIGRKNWAFLYFT